MRRFFFSLVLLSLSNIVAAADIQKQSLDYLNRVRAAAGMVPFYPEHHLQRAAAGHARYLLGNRQWDHLQDPGRPGFTGIKPLQRILAAGYNNRHISENISSHQGSGSPLKSIDGLMSAIYHRFAFLSFDHDEIGIGYESDADNQVYVYNMGNSTKREFCAYPEKVKPVSEYIYLVCAKQDTQLNSGIYDAAILRDRKQNPEFVVWPAHQATGIAPAFYEESPDPLPDIDVSGYPVSIQFNPGYYPVAPRVTRFELFLMPGREPVRLAATFDKQRDLHQKFSRYEFAIFPLYRLNWNSVYQAEVDLTDSNGKQRTLVWQFRTYGFSGKLHHVLGGETIRADADVVYVYAPPASHTDGSAELLISYRGFTDVQVKMYDAHTLMIKTAGNSGQAIFDFHGRRFRLLQ